MHRPGDGGAAEPVLSGTSATEHAYRSLLEMILNRRLRAGSVVQERRLAESLGVSRTPLREALSRLTGEGLLVRQGNRSLVIRPFDLTEYMEVLHVRRVLEGEAAALAAGSVEQRHLRMVRAQIEALMSMSEPSVADHWAADDALHDTVAEAAGSRLMATLIKEMRQRTRMFDLKRLPERFLPGCQEHLVILDALETGDAQGARAAMAQHIENVKASILRELSRF